MGFSIYLGCFTFVSFLYFRKCGKLGQGFGYLISIFGNFGYLIWIKELLESNILSSLIRVFCNVEVLNNSGPSCLLNWVLLYDYFCLISLGRELQLLVIERMKCLCKLLVREYLFKNNILAD